jgi:hypothetical protein
MLVVALLQMGFDERASWHAAPPTVKLLDLLDRLRAAGVVCLLGWLQVTRAYGAGLRIYDPAMNDFEPTEEVKQFGRS